MARNDDIRRGRSRSRRDDDDDDDDRPRRRSRRDDDDDDDDEDDRPRSRRSRRDDDDDDRQRRRSRGKKSKRGGGNTVLYISIGGGALLVVALVILLFVWPGFLVGVSSAKIVGTWELTKGSKTPISDMTVEFSADKRVKVTYKAGVETVYKGNYEIIGEYLKTTIEFDDFQATNRDKIKTLTSTQLILENEKGETEEYKRK